MTSSQKNSGPRVLNASIIAHVDHGKTTLSDALLARAHILNQERSGTTRKLDFDQEEIDRGITIKSTGISLLYEDFVPFNSKKGEGETASVASTTASAAASATASAAAAPIGSAAASAASAATTATSAADTIYIGNLPFPSMKTSNNAANEVDLSAAKIEEQVKQLCSQFGQVLAVTLRPKRGFANVQFASDAEAGRAVTASPSVWSVMGRELVVELQGTSPLQMLAKVCEERGFPAPTIQSEDNNNNKKKKNLKAESVAAAAAAADNANNNNNNNNNDDDDNDDDDDDGGSVCTLELPEAGLSLTSRRLPTIKAARRDVVLQALQKLSPELAEKQRQQESQQQQQQQQEQQQLPQSGLLLNLIDSPGHVDFSGEVTAALRITDGALVVVDPFDNKDANRLCVQTETVLRQALAERVKPVLVLNKIDKGIQSLRLSPEELYQRLAAVLDSVNSLVLQLQPEGFDWVLDPLKGNVLFGSGLQGWFFSLDLIAEQLAKKAGAASDPSKILPKLWGEQFVDKKTGKWSQSNTGKGEVRGFCSYVLDPLYTLFKAADPQQQQQQSTSASAAAPSTSATNGDDTTQLKTLAGKLNIPLLSLQQTMGNRELLTYILRQWLPAANNILRVMDRHLPSPQEAQVYRAAHLYEGDSGDPIATSMARCDPAGPLVIYVSKMVAAPKGGKKGALIAYGRVFSGTAQPGDTVYVLGDDHKPPEQIEANELRLGGVALLMADKMKSLEFAVAGMVIGIYGLEKHLAKSGTIVSQPASHKMKVMRFSVSPVVRIAVEAEKSKNPTDNSKLTEAMKTLAKSDPTVLCYVDEQTGQKIVAGAGELHLEVRLKTLSTLAGINVVAASPVVQHCETVCTESPVCLAKSSNKHNRLFVRASPLGDEIIDAMEKGAFSSSTDSRVRSEVLVRLGWSRDHAKRVMAIEGTCVLVDLTQGIDLSPIRDMVCLAFKEICTRGPLCQESLRGARFDIVDAMYHRDGPHRRVDQILPMARRVFQGAIMSAGAALLEPMFAVNTQVEGDALAAVCAVIKKRKGQIVADNILDSSGIHQLDATLPVATSFGFNGDIRGASSGRAFPNCAFSHWKLVEGDVLDAASTSAATIQEIRARKQLEPKVNPANYYLDTL